MVPKVEEEGCMYGVILSQFFPVNSKGWVEGRGRDVTINAKLHPITELDRRGEKRRNIVWKKCMTPNGPD